MNDTSLDSLRGAIDGDRRRLCDALNLRADGNRYFCPQCQNDGGTHRSPDFSIEAGFRCHKCGYTADGFGLVQEVKHCTFPEAIAFARSVYGQAAPMPAKCAERGAGVKTIHKTLEDAAKACAWSVSNNTGKDWQATRKDVYRNAEGVEIGLVIRLEPADGELDAQGKKVKTFRPFHKVPTGWQSGDPSGLWPLFNLPEVLAASGTTYITEGEKAAEAGMNIGLTCATSAHGAKSPEKTDWEPLKGKSVVILPDNDEAGRGYAEAVAKLCRDAGAASVKIVSLPNLPAKGDLREFVDAGGTAEQIKQLATKTAEKVKECKTAEQVKTAAPSVETLRAELWKLAQEKGISSTEFNRKAASIVVAWLHGRGRFYFHAEHIDFAGVMFFDNERKLLLSVQGDAFLAWLAEAMGVNRSETVFKFAASAVETEGLSDRAKGINPACFWAARRDGDKIKGVYISSGAGEVVRITAGNVETVDNGADGVLFSAGAVLEPWHLVEGRDPFEACSVFSGMSTAAPHGRDLLKIWAMTLFADLPCKPPLCVSSTVGGGKTALVRALFRLLGITENINAVNKNGEGDFWATLDGGGLACFDNVDTRIDWLPDALAAAATAGSHQKRKLYTDADRVTLRARAAVAVTSASPSFASDAGLADRLIVIRLERRTGETAESSLFDEVTAARNAGLSWIAAALSQAIADTAPTPSKLNARHPDFASFAVKIGRAIGREAESVEALRAAEADKSLFNLENDSVGAALLELMQVGTFNGTAADLLKELKEIDPSFEGTLSAKRLAKRIAKLWPHLEATFKAKSEKGHGGINRFVFSPPANGGIGGFETAFSQKSLVKEEVRTLPKTSIESHQSHQFTAPTLFETPREPEIPFKTDFQPAEEEPEPEPEPMPDDNEPTEEDENAEMYPVFRR